MIVQTTKRRAFGAYTAGGRWVPGPPNRPGLVPSPWCPNFGAVVPTPFYLEADPVGSFLRQVQASLGVPQTGVWDLATHNALWNWVMARESFGEEGGISDMPPVLPWKTQVCASDGFPMTEAGGNCVDTAGYLIQEAIDNYLELNPAMVRALGWDSMDAMMADGQWQAAKNGFATNLIAHVRSRLAASPCPEGEWYSTTDGTCAPIVGITPVTPEVTKASWYRRPGVLAAGAGVVVLGGVLLGLAARRRRG